MTLYYKNKRSVSELLNTLTDLFLDNIFLIEAILSNNKKYSYIKMKVFLLTKFDRNIIIIYK